MNRIMEPGSWFAGYMLLDKGELADIADNILKLEEYVKRLDPSVEKVEIGWKTLRNSRYLLFKTSKPTPVEELHTKTLSRTPELRGLSAIYVYPSNPDLDTEEKSVSIARKNLILGEL